MVELIIQLTLIAIWSATLVIHTRRLLRLARVEAESGHTRVLRRQLGRLWWWLGREEFWRAAHADGLRCMQLTIMVFLLVLGIHN